MIFLATVHLVHREISVQSVLSVIAWVFGTWLMDIKVTYGNFFGVHNFKLN